MAEEGEEKPNMALLHTITATAVLDGDGDEAIEIRMSPNMNISTALGLLEYAKVQIIRTWQQDR